MKKLIVICLIAVMGAAKAQDMQIDQITFPSRDFARTITGMTQDKQGYLWLLGGGGLLKYDGENLKRYANERDNPNSLISNRPECLATGHDGAIWIGTFSQGLVRFDPISETFTNYVHDPADPHSIRSDDIRAIVPLKDGGLWIGTLEGIDYFDPKTRTFHHDLGESPDARLLQKEHIRVLYLDKSGTLWAGASSPFYGEETEGGLFRIDTQTKAVKRYIHTSENNSLMDNRVSAIFEDSKGYFWVGTAGDGLHTMDREKGIFIRHSYNPAKPDQLSRPPARDFNYAADHIRFITEDAEGGIWIGTIGNGINRYDPASNTVRHFGTDEPGLYHLPTNNFWSCLKTADNLLWLGVWQGLGNDQLLTKINLAPYQVRQTLLNNVVTSFEEGEAGAVYMGARNALFGIDPDGVASILFENPDPAIGEINHLLKDNKGNLWISSNEGLHYFNVKTKALTSYILSEEEVISKASNIFQVSAFINDDSLLVGSDDGLLLFDINRKKFTYLPQASTGEKVQGFKRILAIFIDSPKNIWVGYRFQGVKKLDLANGTYKDYTGVKAATGVYDFFVDASHNLFAAGGRWGLRKYDPELDEFILINDKSNLLNADSYIWSVTQTDDSTLWLNTGVGLVKYDIASNSTFLYSESWGLSPYNIYTYQLFQSSKGDIYLGTSSGYLKFRPEDFARKSGYEPQPFIFRFRTGEQDDWLRRDSSGKDIRLQYDQNNVSLTLGYVNYLTTGGDKNLQYRLEPYDDEWRSGKNGEEVSYYKLIPGEYRFRLRALDTYGEWVETSLAFSVAPPWWRTWWAYSFYGLCLIAAMVLFDRFQRKRLLEKERAKAKERELAQAKEIEKAYTVLKTTQAQLIQSEKLASLGELTAGIAHEIKNPLNFVNNFSDLSVELIEEVFGELQALEASETKEDITAVLNDVKANLQKIHHHGRRADSIVQSMLLHSRESSGVMEPTDLNAFVNEYVHLAFHSMRAGKEPINVTIDLDLDEQMGQIAVVVEDFSRVILNLCNNAFDAMREKLRAENDYQPQLTIRTHRADGHLRIEVTDNGPGIPEAIREKIFQPFFTTKKGTEGTGLGLSIAHDIVKAHGGYLSVDSAMGVGTTLGIILPAREKGN